jgi:hypothetical protein
MSKHRKRAHHPEGHLHTCPTCQHQYQGHFCNNCGEKIFHPHDLSLGHLLEDAVDKFTHFDLKIPKSILLLFNPGYLTEQFLMGIRKPFANPVQLFLIANVIFFLFYKITPFSDFTPSWGDQHYFKLSEYKTLTWTKPLDNKVEQLISDKIDAKWAKMANKIPIDASKITIVDSILQHTLNTSSHPHVVLFDAVVKGPNPKIKIDETYQAQINMDFYHEMQKNSAAYSKSLIFLLILLVAPFIYLFYRKSFQNIGTVLIFATHFVSCYILYFGLNSFLIINYDWRFLEPFSWIYSATKGTIWRDILNFVGGFGFEFNGLPFLMAYLFFAFRRLFKPHWGYNLFASYCISRIFFFLCFGVYKKIILWIAVSNY